MHLTQISLLSFLPQKHFHTLVFPVSSPDLFPDCIQTVHETQNLQHWKCFSFLIILNFIFSFVHWVFRDCFDYAILTNRPYSWIETVCWEPIILQAFYFYRENVWSAFSFTSLYGCYQYSNKMAGNTLAQFCTELHLYFFAAGPSLYPSK